MQPVCTVRVPKITTTITVACVHPALTPARTAQLRELRHSGDEGSRACNAAERLRYLKRARLTKRFPSRTSLQASDYVDALGDSIHCDALLATSIIIRRPGA